MKRLAVLFVLLPSAVFAQQASQPPQPVIVTSGEGIVKQAPDRAWVTIGTQTRGKTAAEVQRLNSEAMTAVIDRIKAVGIPADAIQTTGYNLQPEFDYANGRQTLRGYMASNQVHVRVDTIAKTGDVIGAAVSTGANNVNGVRFDLKNRDSAEREALRLAVREARGKADALASGAGVQIDRVVRIEEDGGGMPEPRPMMARMEMSAVQAVSPNPPIEAGEIEVRARVTLTASIR